MYLLVEDYLDLKELEEMEDIIEDSKRLDSAALLSTATWSPKGLRSERQRVLQRAREFSCRAEREPAMSVAELREWMAMHAARIADRGIFGGANSDMVQ